MVPSIYSIFAIIDTKKDLTVSFYFVFSLCAVTVLLIFLLWCLGGSPWWPVWILCHSFSAMICLAFAEFFSCVFMPGHVVWSRCLLSIVQTHLIL